MKRLSLSRRQHDQILAGVRRRHEAEVSNLKADNERLRGERDQFAKDRDAIASTAQRDAASAASTITRLREDLDSVSSGGDNIPALRRRIKHLEKELDNALGMPPGGLLDSAPWQPGNVAPTPDKAVSS